MPVRLATGSPHESGTFYAVRRIDGEANEVHAPEPDHAPASCHGARPELNAVPVLGGRRAPKSFKRLLTRLESARDLDDAMRLTGQTGCDVGAALDYSREIVQRIRVGDAPFEVGHVRLLPMAVMAILLGRLVARLDVAGRAVFADEERRVREAGTK